ncbi:hypothetical protein [Chlorogloeopsis fritschii]|uniref:hypothetical protein n=1 Tax=Chlorogloeopsis fritschii TaxID=1124 RepID=UPI0023F2841B|nr:hypothetical protein [Chlorogloeopsis fritschii]
MKISFPVTCPLSPIFKTAIHARFWHKPCHQNLTPTNGYAASRLLPSASCPLPYFQDRCVMV